MLNNHNSLYFDYFYEVRNHFSVTNHIGNLVSEAPTFMDTNIVPTLEHCLKDKSCDDWLIRGHNYFMRSFNQWLSSENLILVPGVREELGYRLQAAGSYALETLKKKDNNLLQQYTELVREAQALLSGLAAFKEPEMYTPTLDLLVYLHQWVNWQKDEHKAGNADDQIIAAALNRAIDNEQALLVFSNDSYLRNTLNCFHRALSSSQTLPNGSWEIAQRLRKAEIAVRSYSAEKKEIGFCFNTIDFYSPCFYDLKQTIKSVAGRSGFKSSEDNLNNLRDDLISRLKSFVSDYNCFLGNKKAKEKAALLPSLVVENKAPEAFEKEKLSSSLEHLLSLIENRAEPPSFGEFKDIEKSYFALSVVAEGCGQPEFILKIKQKQDDLQAKKQALEIAALRTQIESKEEILASLMGKENKIKEDYQLLSQTGAEIAGLIEQMDKLKEKTSF